MAEKLRNIKDPSGKSMNTIVYKIEDLFPEQKGNPPDLMVYFDDLNWRSAGTLGYDSIYLEENDTGPDSAVHDYYGLFMMYDPSKKIGKQISDINIIDVAPTILKILDFPIPKEMEGKIIKLEE